MLAILKRITRRTGEGEGGQSLVEFTLVLPIFLLVLFAIIDFGMAFHAWITVTNSAREGARLGTVGAAATDIEQRVRYTADTLDQADLTVAITNAQGEPGESVVVDVSYAYSLITPLADILGMISGGSIGESLTLSSTADMRLE
jgi:Flp pilus assembly protein TadG